MPGEGRGPIKWSFSCHGNLFRGKAWSRFDPESQESCLQPQWAWDGPPHMLLPWGSEAPGPGHQDPSTPCPP